MDEDKLRELCDALGLTLWGIVAKRLGKAKADQIGRSRDQAEDEARAQGAMDRSAALIASAAKSGLVLECREARRAMGADAKRHGERVGASPGAAAMRTSFADLVEPVADPKRVLIEGYDGEWREYSEALRSYVEAATSAAGPGIDELARQVAARASQDGVRIKAGRSGAMELTGYVRMRVRDRMFQAANRDRWAAAEGLGMDAVEISAHATCAPDHARYQGKIMRVADWNKLNDHLERPIGTGAMNCRHVAMPCYSDSTPAHSEAYLRDVAERSEASVSYVGRNGERKTVTRYEATQLMRERERTVRKLRTQSYLMRQAGMDTTSLDVATERAVARYRAFCQQVKMAPDMRRTQIYTVSGGMAAPRLG